MASSDLQSLPVWDTFLELLKGEAHLATMAKDDEEECPVCREAWGEKTVAIRLTCKGKHLICRACAISWFETSLETSPKGSCPSCREAMVRRNDNDGGDRRLSTPIVQLSEVFAAGLMLTSETDDLFGPVSGDEFYFSDEEAPDDDEAVILAPPPPPRFSIIRPEDIVSRTFNADGEEIIVYDAVAVESRETRAQTQRQGQAQTGAEDTQGQ